MAGVRRRRAAGHPVAGDEQRPVEAAAVVRHEPGVGRDVARRARRAGPRSSAWSGSSSWTWRNRSPSHQPSPMRNATVPAAVASPVVSVSRQTSGTSGRRLAGQRARAAPGRAAGRRPAARRGRTAPPGVVDDLAVERRRQPLAPARRRARRGRAAGSAGVADRGRPPGTAPAAGRGRSVGRATARRARHRPSPGGRRPAEPSRPSSASRRSASALRVDVRLEPRARAGRAAAVAAARRDQLRARRRAARRGAPTAARTGRSRRAPPRTGRSSAPPRAASGPGSRGRGRAGRPSAGPRRRSGSPARRRAARRRARRGASRRGAPSAVSQ